MQDCETTDTALPKQIERAHVVAACLMVLTHEVYNAGLETQTALDLLRDAPDKIEAALTRGSRALVVYRLDKHGARSIVGESDARLKHFVATAEQSHAPMFGFCPAAIAEVANCIEASLGSLRKDA
ncbi:hypothetical protein [Shimia abyssi]|uniref:Uncharacterized protein n=1 Tax=Shimia abyssi TaxID=1662395 RepID=A0A2P8FHD6_9RHOB|nr:hypothetical protein [Shimia abyssi]PSL21106.1 hypothetical protein CLV88_102226 [Shimia abyssi]